MKNPLLLTNISASMEEILLISENFLLRKYKIVYKQFSFEKVKQVSSLICWASFLIDNDFELIQITTFKKGPRKKHLLFKKHENVQLTMLLIKKKRPGRISQYFSFQYFSTSDRLYMKSIFKTHEGFENQKTIGHHDFIYSI